MDNYCFISKWRHKTPCLNTFDQMLNEDPNILLNWIESGKIPPEQLTYAVDVLGKAKLPILDCILNATKSESPVVREGAVYGLAKYFTLIKDRLESMALGDSSQGVRASAKELLGI